MTQNEWVYTQLKLGRTLTAMDALMEHGVGRLAARIKNLEDPEGEYGCIIRHIPKTVVKRDGTKTRVMSYRMGY